MYVLGEGEHHSAYHKKKELKVERKRSQDLKIQPTTEAIAELAPSEWDFAPGGLAAPPPALPHRVLCFLH